MMPLPRTVSMTVYQRHTAGGFSLLEVLVVVVIMGIAMGIGLPGLRTLMDNQKMKTATFDLVTSVMQARSDAIRFGATSGASISIVATSVSPTGTAATNAAKFSNGWCIVFTSASACDVTNPAGDVMSVNAPVANVVYTVKTCTTTAVTDCMITFGRSGRLLSGVAVKIQVDNDSGGGSMPRCVTIDASGNAMTKVAACT
jgi:prepilin-type N-terminal cleavage/methylation domain-containing protein